MYEELRSTTVHTPITLSEYGQIANRFPDALNWAGGTYLMSRPNFYPMDSNIEIIDLSGIEELQRITRTDRYIEIGSMVTAAQLLDTGRQILPPVLLGALTSIGSTIVRRQITVGGSLCIPDIRLSIPTALAVLDAMAEVRNLSCERQKRHPVDSRLTPVRQRWEVRPVRRKISSHAHTHRTAIRSLPEISDYGESNAGGKLFRHHRLPSGKNRRSIG